MLVRHYLQTIVLSCVHTTLFAGCFIVYLWDVHYLQSRLIVCLCDTICRPFYRTEQLIITATNSSKWLRADPQARHPPVLYGPVFRKSILHEVLALQQRIEALTARVDGRNVTLADVCFAPLLGKNEAKDVSKCSLQVSSFTAAVCTEVLVHVQSCTSDGVFNSLSVESWHTDF